MVASGQAVDGDGAALASIHASGHVWAISHGRVIEAGLVTCLPHGDFAACGAPFQHEEGIRLAYENEQFTSVEFLRLPAMNAETNAKA